MWLHLGQNTVVHSSAVLGVYDLDNCTVSSHTKKYLSKAQKEQRVVNVSMELPKSFIVCREKGKEIIYISQLSPSTLFKRLKSMGVQQFQ